MTTNYTQAILSFIFVILLLVFVLFLISKLKLRYCNLKNEEKRLFIKDIVYIDNYRRIFLIEKDNKEQFMVLTGKNSESIIHLNNKESRHEIQEF